MIACNATIVFNIRKAKKELIIILYMDKVSYFDQINTCLIEKIDIKILIIAILIDTTKEYGGKGQLLITTICHSNHY